MHYCAYSFSDLFQAAYGRGFTAHEEKEFAALTQPKRNQKVRELAKLSGWQTEDVPSLEGPIFTAFWPQEIAPR